MPFCFVALALLNQATLTEGRVAHRLQVKSGKRLDASVELRFIWDRKIRGRAKTLLPIFIYLRGS